MKAIKKMATALALTVVLALGAQSLLVSAANYDFSFNVGYGTDKTTGTYYKNTDSSVYMYCGSASNSNAFYIGYVQGAGNGYGWTTVSDGYYFYQGTTRYMNNYVYENGMYYCRVYAKSNYGITTFTGRWRPDL